MKLPTSSRCMSPPTGENPEEDREIPFPVKSGNGSTPNKHFSCAMPKTQPVGDALQSTTLQSADDDDDDDDDDEGIF